jgi:maleylacetoacetate isomerase
MSANLGLELYSYYRSSAAYRVRIALELKELSWRQIPVNLLEGDQKQETYLQVNPQGLVPALVTPEGTITQSLAIIEYLEETYPQSPLLPGSAIDRAQVRSMAYQIAMEIHPLNNPRVTQFLTAKVGAFEAEKMHWYHHWIQVGFTALERRLTVLGSKGSFCFGNSVSLADLCLIPQVYNALRFDCPLQDYPIICAIYDHCHQMSAFSAASPEAQSDYPAK